MWFLAVVFLTQSQMVVGGFSGFGDFRTSTCELVVPSLFLLFVMPLNTGCMIPYGNVLERTKTILKLKVKTSNFCEPKLMYVIFL